MIVGGEVGGGNWVSSIKEVTRYNEHWVLHMTENLLKTTSETNGVLQVGKLNLN